MATAAPSSPLPKTYGLLCFAVGGGGWSAKAPSGQPQARPVAPEIHFNIWEREPHKKHPAPDAFLDIGIMLDVQDQTTSIEMIFPFRIPLASVKDLAAVISDPKAVPAVFNESWAVASSGTQGADAVVYDPAGQSESFAIVNVSNYLTDAIHAGHDALSISVPGITARAKDVAQYHRKHIERVYVRFRILHIKPDFYAVGAGTHKDDWWMPSWQRTEDIDFRLNVRRGAPHGLEGTIGRFVEFSKVHLFLMRSRDKDIVFLDKLFKASRSLEDEEFWAQYSLNGAQTLEANRERIKNSLGYQWKKVEAPPELVREFSTLARFKIVEFGIGKFLLIALLVGAAGNGLWDGVKVLCDLIRPAEVQKVADLDTGSQKERPTSNPEGARMQTTPTHQAGNAKEPK